MVWHCSKVVSRWDEVVKTTRKSQRSSGIGVSRGSPAAVLRSLLKALTVCSYASEHDGDGMALIKGSSRVG